ncbi:rod shape-determining protein MreB [Porphyromonas crevioricanis]|uniref:Cell shape-determining protein MreB n=2 Tax=Porphyromonas crevioricanis TaxID=393921 RepID=A0A0A2FE64_9PORP|nr:rod shape-determining protein [Porphyromonas crevioricanis]KGN89326.1 rod shape-determining protein MreB [Porphyromonas crevioricanis]KGN93702.1 rod shape-determining protein MreB [Porphyromonas crevioricanis]SKA02353.1 rod shape-determining protein MreB [Porphyromonas crevioricanis]SQH73108.1 Rod shape-determining protein MreB [Porphyromonas crevioricanis]GAD05835.1 rod shape-determining protein MreB [Porphyromonas crevioricanis JCM 15906]
MGLFNFRQSLAIDLGTANTIIIKDGKVVLDEPSVVSFDSSTNQVMAVGKIANEMYEKGNANIRTVRPLRDGVIADFNAAEQMIRGMIRMISKKRSWFSPSLRTVVCIPSGSTEVEIRAVRDSSEHAGSREVFMIHEPMAAAVGIGIDVLAPEGNMIVDIGGGTTEIAVISLGGIVKDQSIRIAGDVFTQDIIDHMRSTHNVKVGERMAEQIKINVGSVLQDLENPPEEYAIWGADLMDTLPKQIKVTHQEIAHCLEKSVQKIEAAILKTLEETPPALYADIVKNGVYLTGGGALLRGISERLTSRFAISFKVAEDPLLAVAKGTGIAVNNIDTFKFLIK